MSNIVVIGGGAAGLMAAGTAAELGCNVTLLERNNRLGWKLSITGKGRCNVTNNCTNSVFIENVNTNPRFLYSSINAFDTNDTIDFFESLGVPLKTERGNRVFPQSDKASDIVSALTEYAQNSGADIVMQTQAKSLIIEDNSIKGVIDTKGKIYYCDAVIIATGGKSYPRTGSTGDGYRLAQEAGHTVISPQASLIPLVCSDEHLQDCIMMQGLSLRNAGVRLYSKNKLIYSDFGELLFTHFGLSGPTILSSSAHMSEFEKGKYTISVDLKPALDFEKLDARLLRDFDKYKNKDISNSLCDLLPSSMIPVVLKRLKFDNSLKCHSITKEQRHALVSLLKDFRFDIAGTRSVEEAIITRGGVRTSEVDPATMESKLCRGLYFCGEVLDVDAYTGGFNLQIAFSTGRLAGTHSVYNL